MGLPGMPFWPPLADLRIQILQTSSLSSVHGEGLSKGMWKYCRSARNFIKNHFGLTFDDARRLIVKDWRSHYGTEVTKNATAVLWMYAPSDIQGERMSLGTASPERSPERQGCGMHEGFGQP
jgi:hypothetical protein